MGNAQERCPIQLLDVQYAMPPLEHWYAILNKINVFFIFCFLIITLLQSLPRFTQKRGIKSAIVMMLTEVSSALRTCLWHFPISFTVTLLAALISLKLRTRAPCLHRQTKMAH
jgi:hypothetical protein